MMKFLKRLLVAWGLWRLFGPETPPRFIPGQKHIAKIPGRTVFVGEHEFFVREAGPRDAPPIVLVHGWGDHSLIVWGTVIPLLAKTYRVFALDSRNTGKSDSIREGFDISDVADELAGVIAQLGLDGPVPIVGYSMGGFVVQTLVRRHPGVASKVVLAGTASCPVPDNGLARAGFSFATVLARALDRFSRAEVSWLRSKYMEMVGAFDPQYGRYFWTDHMGRDAETYWASAGAVSRFDSRAWVGKLGLPVLVIINTADQLVAAALQYELASLIPDVEVVEVVGANHEAPVGRPEAYAEAITSFVEAE